VNLLCKAPDSPPITDANTATAALLGHAAQALTDRYIRDREMPVVDGPNLGQSLDVGQKGV
jgi:hypothetical protein